MSAADSLDTGPSKCAMLSADDPPDSQAHPPDVSSVSGSVSIQHHPEIWFDDGNIVLVAGATAFRIYRGLLTAQSTIFSDMFASSTCSPDETFDGCPVVHLSDSAHDLTHLLRVLLPKSRIHYYTTSASPVRTFPELFAVIRLAHKYNIPQVQEQALASLHELGLFATSFTAYFTTPTDSQLIQDPWLNIAVVNIARLTDTPSLLPLALYRCAYLCGDVFDGYKHEDCTVEYLSEMDLRWCFEARATLIHEHTVFISALFDDPVSAACTNPARCATCLRHAQRNAVCSQELALENGALRDWDEVVRLLGEGGTLCKGCTDELLGRSQKGQKKVFDKLPAIFGITVEGWGVETAMGAAVGQGE